MPAAEIQSGTAYIYGIHAVTITCASPSVVLACNISNIRVTTTFKEDEMTSQNGSVIEALIASAQRRRVEFDLAPTGTTRANAVAEVDQWLSLANSPNVIITLADVLGGTSTSLEGTYNLKSGGSYAGTRDGVGVIGVQLESYETAATAGTFAGLATISG